MTKAAVFTLLVLSAVIVSTSESRGDGKPTLSAAQQAAKAEFDAAMAEPLKNVKAACGVDIPVVTDFENFNRTAWIEFMFEDENRYRRTPEQQASLDAKKAKVTVLGVAANCGQVLEFVERSCKSTSGDRDKPRRGEAPPPPPAPKVSPIKSVACLFAGLRPRQENDRSDDFALRNMTFANGAFTIRNHPRMANIDANTWTTTHPSPVDTEHDRTVGAACTKASQCTSLLCSRSTCQWCSDTLTCPSGFGCIVGRCVADRGPSDDDGSSSSSGSSSSKSSSKPAPKSNGAQCASDSECASKICGTIKSPGGNHKCGSKR